MAIGDNLSKRDQIMVGVGVVALIGAGLFWYFPYQAEGVALAGVQTHIESVVAGNTQARRLVQRGNTAEIRQQADELQQTLDVMRQLVPTANEVAPLLNQVSDAARRSNLEIGNVTPLAIVPGPEFDTYRYQISLLGGYNAIASFIANVATLNRIVTPVGVQLQVAQQNTGTVVPGRTPAPVQAQMEIWTYVVRTVPLTADSAPPKPGAE